MAGMLTDPAFLATTYAVIDFEALTPAGRPPEPVEVAAVALRPAPNGWMETGRFEALMRPPDDVPVTWIDTGQGLSAALLRAQPPQSRVMAALDARLADPPYRLVAHSAHTEATLIAGKREHCPVLAEIPLLCTVRLARIAYPELSSHALDSVLRYLHIPRPDRRHRAMPDAEVTAMVFQRLIADGTAAGHWTTLTDLDIAAAIYPKRLRESGDESIQEELF
jgi:DNA polymerase-3 subunit epsilon